MEASLSPSPLGPRPGPGPAAVPAPAPLGVRARQVALPFDDEADRPVGYALTPSAQRLLAPERPPLLRIVPSDPPSGATDQADEEPHDIRPARARAMRRAGHEIEVIALRLAADPARVAGWVADVRAPRPRRSARRGAAPTGTSGELGTSGAPTADLPSDPSSAIDTGMRRRAAREVAHRLTIDAAFARDLGMLAAGARRDGATIAVTLQQGGLAAVLVERLRRDAALEPAGVRVVLRVGPARSADRARHEWSERLGLPLERVAAVRWPLAADPEAVEATLHVVAPDVVARVLGWMDAVTDGLTGAVLRASS